MEHQFRLPEDGSGGPGCRARRPSRGLSRAYGLPAGVAQRRGDRSRRGCLDANADMLHTTARGVPAKERDRIFCERMVERGGWLGCRAHRGALASRRAIATAAIPCRWSCTVGNFVTYARRVPPTRDGSYDPGNKKLPGGSQPPPRYCCALALQPERDLSARADLKCLRCLRSVALRGA